MYVCGERKKERKREREKKEEMNIHSVELRV
jgi:hypothetical protein